MVLKMMDISQQRIAILAKGETNEVSPTDASAWIVSCHSTERGTQAEPGAVGELRRWTWESEETKAAGGEGRGTREERVT